MPLNGRSAQYKPYITLNGLASSIDRQGEGGAHHAKNRISRHFLQPSGNVILHCMFAIPYVTCRKIMARISSGNDKIDLGPLHSLCVLLASRTPNISHERSV